ncbi:MAG: hypothetical protein ACLFTK_02770 [Anaerolineales bacterium]
MALYDIIMEDQTILASLVAVFLPLLLAVLAVLRAVLVGAWRGRRARQAIRRDEQLVAQVEPAPFAPEAPDAVPVVALATPPNVSAATDAGAPSIEDANDETLAQEPEVASEMQALLTSVFTDDEAEAQRAVLLSNAQDLRAGDLLNMAESLYDQLMADPNPEEITL